MAALRERVGASALSSSLALARHPALLTFVNEHRGAGGGVGRDALVSAFRALGLDGLAQLVSSQTGGAAAPSQARAARRVASPSQRN